MVSPHSLLHRLSKALAGSVAQRGSTLLAPGTLGHVHREPQVDRDPEKRFSHGSQVWAEMTKQLNSQALRRKHSANATP